MLNDDEILLGSDEMCLYSNKDINVFKYIAIALFSPTIFLLALGIYSSLKPVKAEVLKEYGGSGRLVVTGIRSQESYKRSKRKMVETCFKDKTKRYINPIIDWSETDVWDFIHQQGLKYCRLYDEGYKRIGCILCPMQTKKGKLRDAERYPKFYKVYLLAFKKMIEHRHYSGLECKWKDPQEVMDWWIYELSKQLQDTLFN